MDHRQSAAQVIESLVTAVEEPDRCVVDAASGQLRMAEGALWALASVGALSRDEYMARRRRLDSQHERICTLPGFDEYITALRERPPTPPRPDGTDSAASTEVGPQDPTH